MLWNLHKKSWTEGLSLAEYEQHCKSNEASVRSMLDLAKTYNKVNTRFLPIWVLFVFDLLIILIIYFVWKWSGIGGRGEDDSRAIGRQERWKTGPETSLGRRSRRTDDFEYCPVLRRHVVNCCFPIVPFNCQLLMRITIIQQNKIKINNFFPSRSNFWFYFIVSSVLFLFFNV